MDSVYIGFSRSRSRYKIFSKIIQLVEKRQFSHSYIIINDMVYQASHGMVHSVTYDNFLKNNIEIKKYKLEISEDKFNLINNYIKNTLGTTYGFDQIFGILIQKIFRKAEPVIVNNSDRMVCSEFCARVLNVFDPGLEIEYDAVTPSNLQEIMEAEYGKNA
jgi:hypothetical protein